MNLIDRWYRWIENVLASIAAISLLLMVVIMVADALGRYALGTGVQGTYQFVELFLFPGLLFLGWPVAHRAGRNVAVDLFRSRIGGWGRRLMDTTVALLMLGFVLLVVLGAYQGVLSEWGKWTVESPSLPIGPSRLLLLVGSIALALRVVLQFVGAITGRNEGGHHPLPENDENWSPDSGNHNQHDKGLQEGS